MNQFGLLLILVLAVLGGRAIYTRLQSRRRRRGTRSAVKALLDDCNGDQDLVERLIFAEMQRDESLAIQDAARAARSRLKRDRTT